MNILNFGTARRYGGWLVCALLATLAPPLHAKTGPHELLNYAAIEKPVYGKRGMVVSQSDAASEVGAQILRDGGNAVDAAIATAFALAVTLPRAGNIGGDGYMLVHLAKEGRTIAIDYRSTAPAAATLDRFLDKQDQVTGDKAGYRAAGVPGTVAGLALAHRKYGKLPWAKLVRPAIRLATEGIVLSRDEASTLNWGKHRLALSYAGAAVFLHPDGSARHEGERLVQPELAWSLQQIAEHGEDAFYRGAIAERLAAGMARHGGLITRADLAAYHAIERKVLRGSYHGVGIAAMPPSSGGGAMIIEMLNILEHSDLRASGAGSVATLHMEAETMKLAWADRIHYAGDPGFVQEPTHGLISKAYGAVRATQISKTRAQPVSQMAAGDPWPYESPHTTQLSVIDADGNAVSNTFTLGSDFGSGVMVEGTGFLLGNLIGNFSIKAQAAAVRKHKPAPTNALAPGRRPVSSMSPTLLFRGGKLWMVTGSPGGNTIPGTVMQMIVDVVDFDMNIAEATHMSRIHQEMRGGDLRVERGLSPDTVRLLEKLGHHVVVGETIGSTQTLVKDEKGVEGAADPRRPGAAAIAE